MTPTTDLEAGGTVEVPPESFERILVLVSGRPLLARIVGVVRDGEGNLVPFFDAGAEGKK